MTEMGYTLNKRKDTFIKHLKMMGYEIIDDTDHGSIRVILSIRNGTKHITTRILYEEIQYDFSVETVVRNINELLKRDL